MPLPELAIRLSDLTLEQKIMSSRISGHEIIPASFIEKSGRIIKGYYKPLSETYPELLTKYVVAVSVSLRALIGERAAEDRLVFDEKENLVGSISLEIPQYRPFLCFGESPPQDIYENELVNPRTSTLLQYNFAEILVAGWIFKCDDRHPGNNSLFGMIDWDMCLYPITHIMKGKRIAVDGVLKDMPEKAFRLNTKTLDNFPVIDGPTHWPTHRFPWNCNIAKRYASVEAIIELARNPSCSASSGSISFHEQMFTALLKAVVVFSPALLKRRLQRYLGETPLNYLALSADKAEALVTAYPQFFNHEHNDIDFVSHFAQVLKQEHEELYRAVVFYKGCKQNSYGVSVPSFNYFLRCKPSAFQAVQTYAQIQNKFESETYEVAESQDEGAGFFSLLAIEKRYHQIWRDSFLMQIKDIISQFKDVIARLDEDIHHASDDELLSSMGSPEFTEAWQLLASIELPPIQATHLSSLEDQKIYRAYKDIYAFMEAFKAHADTYFAIPLEALDLDANHAFVCKLSDMIRRFEFDIFSHLSDKTINAQMAKLLRNLDILVTQINFLRHLRSADDPLAIASVCDSYTLLQVDHSEPQIIQACLRELFNWAQSVDKELLNNCIATVIDEDYGKVRAKEAPVKFYLKESTEHGADKLAYILSEAGFLASPLVGKIISRLIPIMLDTLREKTDIYLLSVRQAFDENRFNIAIYSQAAVIYAQQNERFTHLYAKSTVHRFSHFMCQWVDSVNRAQLKAYYQEAYKGYSSNSWFLSFMSNRRDLKTEEYLSEKSWSNSLVLLKTFSEGETKSTSLNTLIFTQLIEKMRIDYQDESKRAEPEYLILSRLSKEHLIYYTQGLKEVAITRLQVEEVKVGAAAAASPSP